MLEFFSKFGLPLEIQSDWGSKFVLHVFQEAMSHLGVTHVISSAYHSESQGAMEWYHQTMKTMLRKYSMEHTKDLDHGVPFLLFTMREILQESLDFSLNELVFANRVRGPLSLVKDAWSSDAGEQETNYCMLRTSRHVSRNHWRWQERMKQLFDCRAEERDFSFGDEVLMLLPLQSQRTLSH